MAFRVFFKKHRTHLKFLFLLVGLAFLWQMQACTCCAYLNHMFNAERAFDEAKDLREARIDTAQEEETYLDAEERKKYDRVIEKGSRVLERFPKNKKRTAQAVFLIAESFRHKQEWAKAIVKYDEFERYFSDHDSMPTVEYQRAYSLYKNGEYNISRFALEPVLEKGTKHPYYYEGQNLLALLEEKSESPTEAIAALENILKDSLATPYMRGKVHFRIAGLYYKVENWVKSREHYTAKEIENLNERDLLTAKIQAAECLAEQKQYIEASKEYEALILNKDFATRRSDFMVRYAELLKLGGEIQKARLAFEMVTKDYAKTDQASRAYFHLGDDEQVRTRQYQKAMDYYDSSFIAKPGSSWGRDSRERRDALRRMLVLQSDNKSIAADTSAAAVTRFFDNEFQIAELFLFKLSELDSALQRLETMIEKSEDTLKVLRATYAKAFIYDEFKNDADAAEEIYLKIIKEHPDTEYAKQAQKNLGMRVTIKTKEDLAYERFLQAESLWFAAEALPLEEMDLVDSAYRNAMYLYDSIYTEFPETRSGIQALFMKGIYYQMNPNTKDSAAIVFKNLRTKHGDTPWGKEADKRLQTRVEITDEELKRLRNRIAQNEQHIERLSKQYYESMTKSKESTAEDIIKSKEEEILESTYDSMYDFE
jgi:tetratricopeptide (TPR) repeat protein